MTVSNLFLNSLWGSENRNIDILLPSRVFNKVVREFCLTVSGFQGKSDELVLYEKHFQENYKILFWRGTQYTDNIYIYIEKLITGKQKNATYLTYKKL